MLINSFQGQKVKGQGHRSGWILWRPPAYILFGLSQMVRS